MISAKSVARNLTWPVDILTVAEGRDEPTGDPTDTATKVRTCGKWAPTQSIEEVGSANWQNADLDVYLPAGTAISGTSRVSIPSGFYAGLWEVVGQPHHWSVGIVARIRRVT